MPATESGGATAVRHDYADITIALSAGVGLTILALFLCLQPLSSKYAASRDFVVYWATGQQLAHHANPYDRSTIASLEHGAGFPMEHKEGLMRNPPWSLFLTLPLGYVDVRVGSLLWSLLELACWFLCSRLLWIFFGRQGPPIHWLAFSFGPLLLCITMGQTSLLPLLGFILFLHLREEHPFLAGAALWLCTLKPHLLLLFWLVLLLWIVRERRYSVLAGAAAAFVASLALTLWIDPQAYGQYVQMLKSSGIEKERIPCFSVLLREWTHSRYARIEYAPSALGCLWALAYYWRRRARWNWLEDGGLLALVSLVFAPYCWLYDQGLALPSLLFAAYHTRSRILVALLGLSSGAVTVLVAMRTLITSNLFLWAGPVWLAWYIAARLLKKSPEAELPSAPPTPPLQA
jgi:hypothetical protein